MQTAIGGKKGTSKSTKIKKSTMRVLFYTAAAVAATIASVSQAVKLESGDLEVFAAFDDQFSQIDAF